MELQPAGAEAVRTRLTQSDDVCLLIKPQASCLAAGLMTGTPYLLLPSSINPTVCSLDSA